MKNISLSLALVALALSACGGPDMKIAKQAYKKEDYQTAYQNYNELAEFGLPSAKVELGKMYLYGRGVQADPSHALKLFKEASAEGDKNAPALIPKAEAKLARLAVKSDTAAVREEGRKALEAANDPESLFKLGQMHEKGEGVPENLKLAEDYYKRAGESNYAKAHYYRARLYQKGEGVPRDIDTAIDLYQKAGDGGFARGYVDIARLYDKGINGKPDYEKSLQYYKLALQKGEPVEAQLKALQKKADDYKVAGVKD